MIYAPVIIPTLNREAHLRRCINSLKKNGYAKYTDIYISVDYPPSDRYIEGHKMVVKYLKENEDDLKKCFNEVHIYYQEKNLGAYVNGPFLRDLVENSGKYEGFIFTEDDNEFSPCFLEYMDKGLEKYKNDDSVTLIASTTDDVDIDRDKYNAFKTISSSAWGIGKWFRKEALVRKDFNRELFEKTSKDFKLLYKIFKKSPLLFNAYCNTLLWRGSTYVTEDGNPREIDLNRFFYNYVNNKYIIRPTVSQTRNWGKDGSGINSGISDVSPLEQVISNESSFDYKISEDVYLQKIKKRAFNEYLGFCKQLINIYLYRIVGEEIYKKIDIDMLRARLSHKIYRIRKLFRK